MRGKLVLLVLFSVLPLFALALYQNFKQRQTEKERTADQVRSAARLIAADHAGYVRNARQLLTTLTGFAPLVLGNDLKFTSVHLENLIKLSPDYSNFGLVEKDGQLFSSGVPPPIPDIDLSDRSYFQRAMQLRQFVIGDYQVGRITGHHSINFGLPVFNEQGEIARVLFAALKLELLSDSASRVILPEGSAVTILDRTGKVLGRVPDANEWIGKSVAEIPLFQRTLKAPESVLEGVGLDGMRRLYAVASVSDGHSPGIFVAVGVPTKILFEDANRALAINLLFLTGITLAALLAAKLLADNSVLKPLWSLVDSAHALAKSNLGARARVKTGAVELQELGSAFDSMAANLQIREKELQQAAEDIRTLNADLEKKVQERTAQLTAAMQELESFSYSVSHDLRAPLRHLDGFAQLLEKSQAGRLDEKGRRYLAVISEAAKKMGMLIDDLLLFSRMGRQELMRTQVDLSSMLQEVIQEVTSDSEERKINWSVSPLPTVHADPAMLRQVWFNLLSNAVKYSRPKELAEIGIGFQDGSKDYTFWVRDNGVGFNMEYAGKLFTVFQRLHLESEFEGTGVGLANVRRVISRHGGRTWAESEIGKGSVFYFTLPKH